MQYSQKITKYKEKFKKLENTSPFPQKLNIETTNFCNLECPMCPRLSMTRSLLHMDFSTFKKIVDESSIYGLKGVWLHVFGEPLLHPQLIEFIKYIKSFKNIKDVGISTNGVLLTKGKSEEILLSGLDRIILSIDAVSLNTYQKIRGADFNIVLENIKLFLKLREKLNSNIKIQLSIIDMAYNHDEIKEFESYWKNFMKENDEILIKPYVNFGNQVNDLRSNNLIKNNEDKRPCRKLWNSLTILSKGDVVACCYDVNEILYLGNMQTESLASIWKGKRLKEYRKIHWDGNFDLLPLCNKCSAVAW